MNSRLSGCLVVVGLLTLFSGFAYWRFTDASSDQSAEECEERMLQPILTKVQSMPPDAELPGRAVVEHLLRGNEGQAERLRKEFADQGISADIEPYDKISYVLKLTEDPAQFRLRATARVAEICRLAEENQMSFESWWLSASGSDATTYVSQTVDGVRVGE